jgi:phosphoenolpyruvate carboxykinase (GTP)
VLAWIAERCEGTAGASETAIGLVPAPGALPVDGLELAPADLEALLAVDVPGWEAELPRLAEHLATFGDRLPAQLAAQLEDLRERLRDS